MHFDIIANEITPILDKQRLETIESDILIISKKITLLNVSKFNDFYPGPKTFNSIMLILKKLKST